MSKPWSLSNALLENIKDFLLDPENIWNPWQATMLYALRSNSDLQGELNTIMQKSIPEDFDSSSAIGIVIRGT